MPLFLVEAGRPAGQLRGALIKRAAPTDKDFQLLKAGQSLTVQAEVSGLYDMSAQGQYSIRYLLPTLPQEAKAAKAKQAGERINVVTLWVDGVSDERVLAKAAPGRAAAVTRLGQLQQPLHQHPEERHPGGARCGQRHHQQLQQLPGGGQAGRPALSQLVWRL